MSTKRRRTGQSSSRGGAAREPQQQQLPDDIEKENAAVLDKLPREVWERILDSLRGSAWNEKGNDLFPFAMTCRYFRDLWRDVAIKERTDTVLQNEVFAAILKATRNASSLRQQILNAELSQPRLRTVLKSYEYIGLIEFDCIYSPTIVEDAIYNDRLSVSAYYVKWLFKEASSTYCLGAAVAAGTDRDGTPRWDVAQGEQNVMELAAAKGDLDLIKWLRNQDPPCEWSKKACTAAAWRNHWDLLRLLVSMGCPIDKEGMFGAVACDPYYMVRVNSLPDSWDGKFEILKWLQREQGCVFYGYWWQSHVTEVVRAAIEHDDLECLQWVRAQGLTWDEIVFGDEGYDVEHLDIALMDAKADVCGLAASKGRLQILQYAVEDGCTWDPARCLRGAEWKKRDHVVKWITDRARQSESEPASLSE